MNRDSIEWTGVLPAITTPFAKDGSVDHAGLRANIERLMGLGCTGVVSAGCTGEFWALTAAEKTDVYRTTVETIGDSGWKIVGAAAITAREAIELGQAAKAAGCDGILVTPPYFARLSDDEIYAHFEAVNAGVDIPIVLYNIPGNAGNALTPALVDRLADLDKVVAIKESSGNWSNFLDTLNISGERIRVFCGPSSTIGVPATLAGCDGLIDCFPNVWSGCIDIWDVTRNGSQADAWALQRTGLALTEMFTSKGRTLYPATKAAMDHLGLPGGGPVRAPLQPLTGAVLDGLHRDLDALGGALTNAA